MSKALEVAALTAKNVLKTKRFWSLLALVIVSVGYTVNPLVLQSVEAAACAALGGCTP